MILILLLLKNEFHSFTNLCTSVHSGLVLLFAIAGCSFDGSTSQDVVILNANSKSKVFIDSVFVGEGDTVKARILNNISVLQIRFEADSCKTEYGVIFKDRYSDWQILSWIPKGISSTNRTLREEISKDTSYYLDGVRYYPYWTPTKKRIIVDNVSINVKKDKNSFYFYGYDNYLYGGEAYRSTQMDSINQSSTTLGEDLEKRLKTLQFTDTSNTVFIDNLNTLVLNCNISKIEYHGVYGGGKRLVNNRRNEQQFFVFCELVGQWSVMDIFGDTLFSNSFTKKSGTYFADEENDNDLYNNAISDAIENSFLDLMKTNEMKELTKIDTANHIALDQIILNKPEKSPSNIEDAMKASFTIKSEDGHGSGFLVSQDGYIITNYHVVNKDKNLKAIDTEGKEYPLKVVRFNKSIDLALLKMEGNFDYAFPIPTVKNFKTGQDVFAIGTPKSIELGQSISKGIISGYRTNKNMNYVQTDLSVNSGNSGGAVITSLGELLGVVEFKLFGIGLEGISFSIPAFDIMKSLSLKYQ